MQALVSVIIPTYNLSRQITDCICSVSKQVYQNIEIVLIDDASTDNTLSVARQALEQGGVKYKIISMRENSGVSAARNAGIEAASGEFITFLDGDDYIGGSLIGGLCDAAFESQPAADVTICGYCFLEKSTGQKHLQPIDKKITSNMAPDVIAYKRIINEIPAIHAILCKKAFIQANGILFVENCSGGEDGEFIIKALATSKKTAICHETGYFYILHDDMGSRNKHRSVKIERYRHHTEAQSRTADFIIERCESELLLNVACSLLKPTVTLRRLSYLAMTEDREAFDRARRETRFGELFMSGKYIFKKPEVFLRALLLYAFPGVYYRHYAKRYK